ncbi:S-layer homology domain-containing protein [Jeotgalibacillus aurantiacus]|uniref:S-layer homology domain-containing protein n=1 Tax=Jeotgalibacillus aurantiacus TaxID=2763266 RepID=UPI001D09DA2D|nr:S-layer homology domain-containing protein [Jeotgalibacillus aurantiacus]
MKPLKKQYIGFVCGALLFIGVDHADAVETKEVYNRFSDVSVTSEFFDEIDSMFYKGVISGYKNGGNYLDKAEFRPNQYVTRAQASKMISIISGYHPNTQENNDYNDVPESHWAHDYITQLTLDNIVSGKENGSFKPEDTLTRAQAAKMIVHAFDLNKTYQGTSFYSDVPSDSWYAPYVNALTEAGITTGRTADRFDPFAKVTRYQLAAFLDRAYNQVSVDEMNTRQTLLIAIETVYRLESMTGYHRQQGYLDGAQPVLPAFDTFQNDIEPFMTENYLPTLESVYGKSCTQCSVQLFETQLNPDRFIEFSTKNDDTIQFETATFGEHNIQFKLVRDNGEWQLDGYSAGDQTSRTTQPGIRQ